MTQDMFDPINADPADVLEHGMAALIDAKHRWPERLQELFDVELALNMRRGMDEPAAARDAAERAFAIGHYLGGRMLYLPSADKLKLALRDAMIYRLSGKVPVVELSRLFGISETRVYCVIKTETDRVRTKLQGRLFE